MRTVDFRIIDLSRPHARQEALEMPQKREELLKNELRKGHVLVASGLDLTGIDLSKRALVGVEFNRCTLSLGSFAGADLSLARFISCDLYSVSFEEAVLYTTWFYDCNLTKANFARAFLLGFRLKNVDITKASFDSNPLVGLERKSQNGAVAGVLQVPLLGELPDDAKTLEIKTSGIYMAGDKRTVVFRLEGDDKTAKYRARLRVAETAKYLKAAHAENGYEAAAAEYYVVERRQRRMALHGSFRAHATRVKDFVFGDLTWRYGTSVVRPLVAFALMATLAAAFTFFAPLVDGSVGLFSGQSSAAYTYRGWNAQSVVSYLNVLYFFLTAPGGGSQDSLAGWVKIVFVIYLLTALWLIALVFEASTKRLGRNS